MSISTVAIFVTAGALAGIVASQRALRRGTTNPTTLALCGVGALVISGLIVLQYGFWSGIGNESSRQTFAPDLFAPGRQYRILWWYGLASAGAGAILCSAWARVRLSRQRP